VITEIGKAKKAPDLFDHIELQVEKWLLLLTATGVIGFFAVTLAAKACGG